MPLKRIAIRTQILRGLFIQRIGRIRFKEEELPISIHLTKQSTQTRKKTNLHPHNNRIQIQHRLPILPQNIQTNIPLEINIWMVNLLRTLDFWRIMREILVHSKGEVEDAAFVHSLVGLDGKREVEDVVGVGEGHFHGAAEGEFLEVYHHQHFVSFLLFTSLRGRWLERMRRVPR